MIARLTLIAVLLGTSPVAAQCRLCAADAPRETIVTAARPLAIAVEAALDLGRAAMLGGGGTIAIDARSGARQVDGLRDLGGMGLTGRVRVTGEPFRQLRITLPPSIRLVAPSGMVAEAVDLRTDLGPVPSLDARGELSFTFGGRLVVAPGAAGDFRGRIPITADYL
jgi:hypothetical protein